MVGAPHEANGSLTLSGTTYVFEEANSWARTQIAAPDADKWDRFGDALSIEGDTIVVGAAWEDVSSPQYSGAAHVFRLGAAGAWQHRHKLKLASAAANDNGGAGVGAVFGDIILVGAPMTDYDDGANYYYNVGAVSFFELQNGTVTIDVLPVNDDPPAIVQPFVSQTVAEDANDFVLHLPDYLGDPDAAAGQELTYSATSSDLNKVVPRIVGDALVLDFQDDAVGTVTITPSVSDGTTTVNSTGFTVTINSVDDAPRIGDVTTSASVFHPGDEFVVTVSDVEDHDVPAQHTIEINGVDHDAFGVCGVEFWQDVNADLTFDPTVDLLFNDTACDGVHETPSESYLTGREWEFTLPSSITNNLALGQHLLFVRAETSQDSVIRRPTL